MTQEERDGYVLEQSMQIIMNSGDARLLIAEAVEQMAQGQFEEAREKLKEAGVKQTAAHNIQTDMIQGDIRGGDEKMGYYVLFAHAQDTMMTIQSELNMAKFMMKIMGNYEGRIAKLEQLIERGE